MNYTLSHILNQQLNQLGFSEEFLLMADANSFRTLRDILSKPLDELHTWPQSGYRMLREFIHVLDSNGLLHLAGKNPAAFKD